MPPTPIAEVMEKATIPPVVPVSKPVEPTAKGIPVAPTTPVVEESEYAKLIKTVDAVKLRGVLMALKYIQPNAGFDTVSANRQSQIVEKWTAFKKKVDNYVQFGTEGK